MSLRPFLRYCFWSVFSPTSRLHHFCVLTSTTVCYFFTSGHAEPIRADEDDRLHSFESWLKPNRGNVGTFVVVSGVQADGGLDQSIFSHALRYFTEVNANTQQYGWANTPELILLTLRPAEPTPKQLELLAGQGVFLETGTLKSLQKTLVSDESYVKKTAEYYSNIPEKKPTPPSPWHAAANESNGVILIRPNKLTTISYRCFFMFETNVWPQSTGLNAL